MSKDAKLTLLLDTPWSQVSSKLRSVDDWIIAGSRPKPLKQLALARHLPFVGPRRDAFHPELQVAGEETAALLLDLVVVALWRSAG